MKKYLFKGFAFATALLMCSCLGGKLETIVIEDPSTGIPDDALATPNPTVTDITAYIPNFTATIDEMNGVPIIRLDMTGVKSIDGTDWLKLYGTGDPKQNIWVEVDNVPKGIDVYNNADKDRGKAILTDIVFTVDNSGSMKEEANAVARDIVSWATLLSNSGLNARFGCVGYGYYVGYEYNYLKNSYGVEGALNLTTKDELDAYLNRSGSTGVERTFGYAGSDGESLKAIAAEDRYSKAGGENGVQAIRFADENFDFRPGANRIYVNFTDDAIYWGGNKDISISYMASQDTWPTTKGTIHSVISNTESKIKSRAQNVGNADLPWLLSEYTGGTTLFAESDFSGVTLESLPVTGAIENSYIIRFGNVDDLLDGKKHKIHITIRSLDSTVQADKTFNVAFSK